MPAAKTSPADGHYFINRRILSKLYACEGQRKLLTRSQGRGNILATLVNVEKAIRDGLSILWVASRMYSYDRITYSEFDAFRAVYDRRNRWGASPSEEDIKATARAFMRMLEKRARREGRLPT